MCHVSDCRSQSPAESGGQARAEVEARVSLSHGHGQQLQAGQGWVNVGDLQFQCDRGLGQQCSPLAIIVIFVSKVGLVK